MPAEPVVQIPAFATSKENVASINGLGTSDINLNEWEKQFHVCRQPLVEHDKSIGRCR